MSKLDIINSELERRKNSNKDLIAGLADQKAAIAQFNQLDEFYRTDEKASRELLESIYLENRHFSGKWPIVYSFAQTQKFPFFAETDADCNPYFPISKVKDGTFDGLSPLFAAPTRANAPARDRDYSGTIEPTLRSAAISALQAFPDNSDEDTNAGSCSDPQYTDEASCTTAMETWTSGYAPGDTATEKLRAALDPWRAEMVSIISDLHNDDGTEEAFWQDILDNVDDVLAAIQTDVTHPSQTQDFTPGSDADTARDYLIANAATFDSHVVSRQAFLSDEATAEEQVFFGIIKLRLHQANGSYAKLKASKGLTQQTESIIADNNAAIESLNVLKVKNS